MRLSQREPSRASPGDAQSSQRETELRGKSGTRSRPHFPRARNKGTSTKDAVFHGANRSLLLPIFGQWAVAVRRVGCERILAPLRGVAIHIKQADVVGLLA